MKTHQVSIEEFYEVIPTLKFDPLATKEVLDLGFKSVEDAYMSANKAWARFYLVKHYGKVIAPILEQRDGNLVFFTTQYMKPKYTKLYIKEMRHISNSVIRKRGVLFVTVARWYKQAQKFLKIVGFKPHIITPRYEVWYKDGKQN